jgi:23S rRNA pseudouridine2605 synthase
MKQRLQKLISAAGLASRRAAEEMIRAGRVTVNGLPASLGMSADPDTDEVRVDAKPLRQPTAYRYIMLHKPRGIVTTLSDDRGRPTVADLTKNAGGRLYPVGRLDMDSEGLLILTDDGATANALMHPAHEVDKVYTAFVCGPDIKDSLQKLNAMRTLEGEPISPPKAVLVELGGTQAEITITIHEGKNRQVRRMCVQCGLEVRRLVRIAEGALTLGDLPSGKWRNLTKAEIAFLHKIP